MCRNDLSEEMIVRITETVYSDFSGVHKLEPVFYKIPRDLQKMVDDIHQMTKNSKVKADIFSAELTDSDNLNCSNPYQNTPSCNKEASDGCDTGTSD